MLINFDNVYYAIRLYGHEERQKATEIIRSFAYHAEKPALREQLETKSTCGVIQKLISAEILDCQGSQLKLNIQTLSGLEIDPLEDQIYF